MNLTDAQIKQLLKLLAEATRYLATYKGIKATDTSSEVAEVLAELLELTQDKTDAAYAIFHPPVSNE